MIARLYDRLAAAVSFALVTALALFTFYLAEIAQRQNYRPVIGGPNTTQPDFFVDQLALLTMNETGQPSLRIEAQKLQHNPSDDSTLLDTPVLVSLDPAHPRMTVTANQGRISADGSEARLLGDVIVTRAATAKAAPMMIKTEAAVIFPDRYIVQTDQAIAIIEGPNRLAGVGMKLDYRQRQLRVDSRVRSVWMPPAAWQPPPEPKPARTTPPQP